MGELGDARSHEDGSTTEAPRDAGDAPPGDARPGDASAPPEHEAIPGDFGNRFGIGLVGEGDALDYDLSADLAGPGGFVKLIFAGVTRGTTGPCDGWVAAVEHAYHRDLIPVIRIGPPWGDRRVRNQADEDGHDSYLALAAAFRAVVDGLPLREDWPIWIEVHNEPNLCYEWACDPDATEDGWLGYEQIAAEYAFMLRDVADALAALDDPRIKLLNGGLAPGGVRRCECGGEGFEAGITSLEFIEAMRAAVPDIFDRLDGWSSHPYPAEGEGWGFFVPFERAMPGLRYHHRELEAIARDLPVLITETGWNLDHGDRGEVAEWTVRAYRDLWLVDEHILAVMPFMLRDHAWDRFGWAAPDGTPYPVYDAVRALRCERRGGRCSP